MIDTHVHIVPEVDDGASSLDEAIMMVQLSINQGVKEIIATPHYNNPMFVSEDVDRQYQLLLREVERLNLDVKLHLSNEIHLNEASIKGLDNSKARTMGNSHYLLIELPFHHFYPFHEQMLFDLQISGYKVLIAHIERYQVFRKKTVKLASLISAGFYGQMSCRYIVEKKTRRKAFDWIENGLVHVIASDAHNIGSRRSFMEAVNKILSKRYGKEVADILLNHNPRLLLEDEPLVSIEPVPLRRFIFW